MKFEKIIYDGEKKTAHGYDDTGAPIVREFPYSMSDSEIFDLCEKEPTKEPPKETPVEPPKEPEENIPPVNDDPPNVDDTTANEKPNVKTKK